MLSSFILLSEILSKTMIVCKKSAGQRQIKPVFVFFLGRHLWQISRMRQISCIIPFKEEIEDSLYRAKISINQYEN